MSASLVVLGSLNMDFVVQVQHLPAPGETVLGSSMRTIPGGKGGNQAAAAGKLSKPGNEVRMIGRVGEDIFAGQLKSSLTDSGVDVSAVSGVQESTGTAFIWVDAKGQNSIVVASGANAALRVQDVPAMRDVFKGASYALFQLETPLEVIEAAMGEARNQGVKTILDPAPAQPLSRGLLQNVDLLTPNESEACLLLHRRVERIDYKDAPGIAEALLALGPCAVVLKLGDSGSYYRSRQEELYYPAFAVDPVDSTAAGDVFNAGLAVALAEHMTIEESLRFANAAAAISVTRLGAQSSVPSRSEVDAFLRN